MPSFKIAVEQQVQTILYDYVGQTGIYAVAPYQVVTWNSYIGPFNPATDLPYVAITAHNISQWQRPRGEVGTAREIWDWTVGIYYLDVDQQDFATGYDRMDVITNSMKNGLENEPKLRNLNVLVNPTGPSGAFYEYVWNQDFTTITWDHSGQEGDYYAFTCEMQLLVQTGRK